MKVKNINFEFASRIRQSLVSGAVAWHHELLRDLYSFHNKPCKRIRLLLAQFQFVHLK